MINVEVTKWVRPRTFALLSALALSAAVALGPGTASAALLAVDIAITPAMGGPGGSGKATFDEASGAIAVSEFAFIGPLGSALPGAVGSAGNGFDLNWFIPDDGNGRGDVAFTVRFSVDPSTGIVGGTYSEDSPTVQLAGAWRLEPAVPIPEPSSLLLLGVGLLGLGFARHFRRSRPRAV